MVHHALKKFCTIQDVHSWHLANGWAGCGYNFFVSKAGQIFKGRPVDLQGAHCKEENKNLTAMSICVEGCYEDFTPQLSLLQASDQPRYLTVKYREVLGAVQTDTEMPKEQFDALVHLIQYLMATHNIQPSNSTIEPHTKYATYKKCPGNYFPWKELMQAVTYSQEVGYGIGAINEIAAAGQLTSPEMWKLRLMRGEEIPDWFYLVMINRIRKGGI